MSKKLDENNYREHLREQIHFLQSSAKLYDLGDEVEAKRMAVGIRVLLYDTQDSKSLLGQMHLKKQMKFISTAQPYQENNLLPQQCLLSITLTGDGFFYTPLMDLNKRAKLLSCRDWGYEIVFSDIHRKLYRRKDLIQFLANMDGGAHVQEEISDNYASLSSEELTGQMMFGVDGKAESSKSDPVYASMRQMTFEVLQSLYRIKAPLFSEQYF